MHHVNGYAQHVGNGDGAVGGLGLDHGGARQRVTLGAGDAHLGDLLLQQVHQLAVLGMHRGHGPEFECALEAVHQRFVVAHDGILVGHEVLEAVHAFFLHQRAHVGAHLLAPPGDGDVEGIVGRRFFGPAAPFAVGVHQRLLRVGDHEVDDARGAARQRGRRAGEEVVHGDGAHERQLHVGVRVNAAGQHVLAAGVQHLRTRRGLRRSILPHGHDAAIDAQHIGALFTVGVDHGATADHKGLAHGGLLQGYGSIQKNGPCTGTRPRQGPGHHFFLAVR